MTKTVYVLVEGPTEEQFVKEVLAPSFYSANIFFKPIITTPKGAVKGRGTGGGIKWNTFKKELFTIKGGIVTTFIDFYALDPGFPGFEPSPSPRKPITRVQAIEAAMAQELRDSRFIPYIQLHEFEALCFANGSGFQQFIEDKQAKDALCEIVRQFPNPEDINEGPNTAPSKRILAQVPFYQKPLMGRKITQAIGLPTLRAKCPHFNEWLTRIEAHPG